MVYINMQYKYAMKHSLTHTAITHKHTQAHTNSVYIRNHVKQRNEY